MHSLYQKVALTDEAGEFEGYTLNDHGAKYAKPKLHNLYQNILPCSTDLIHVYGNCLAILSVFSYTVTTKAWCGIQAGPLEKNNNINSGRLSATKFLPDESETKSVMTLCLAK